jgi:DNA-binding IclR family transcriptional regulator
MTTLGVAAVDRALRILEAFRADDRGLTLAEIARRTGYYKSTILRLADSLEKFGFLKRSSDGLYQIGYKPLFLASLYQGQFRSSDHVLPVLRRLVDEWNESASFYVREGDRRICTFRVQGRRSVTDTVREGDTLDLRLGAAGRVLLAFGGERGTRYDQIRRELFAASFGERDPETAAYACPVFGQSRAVVGCISLSGPRYRIETLAREAVVASLAENAAELTAAFGGDATAFGPLTAKRA